MRILGFTVAIVVLSTHVASASPAFMQQMDQNLRPRGTEDTVSLQTLIVPLELFEEQVASVTAAGAIPAGGLTLLSQEGDGNAAAVTQDGLANAGWLVQSGDANTASLVQTGNYNIGAIQQTGFGNAASLVQSGNGHAAMISQQGRGNVAIIQQR